MPQKSIQLAPPTRERLAYIAEHMRQCDKDETWAASGENPLRCLWDSIEHSYQSFVVVVDGVPSVATGIAIADYQGYEATPWMLAIDNLQMWRRQFLELSSNFIRMWNGTHPMIYNWVDLRNTESIRWLKWLGFVETHRVENYGFEKRPFVCMEKCVT